MLINRIRVLLVLWALHHATGLHTRSWQTTRTNSIGRHHRNYYHFGISRRKSPCSFKLQPFISQTTLNDSSIPLEEVDLLYNKRKELFYDTEQDRYIEVKATSHREDERKKRRRTSLSGFVTRSLIPRISVALFPAGVTSNYFAFIRWRVLQRFVNANLHVFGTQSLLLGLGIKSRSAHLGALSAALNWVLKDALGKIVRMLWASHMGRRFDSDAKRWRFRSSFVFAAGNGLEIITYIYPGLFLVWATLANCCKQISMLTSSSTRTAIYNSFRDGSRENIGDITAKGEAQIAIVDLLGIASGVTLSRYIGTSVKSVVAIYAVLQVLEIFCMYRQLRNVVYRVLNFERLVTIAESYIKGHTETVLVNGERSIPTPEVLSRSERIFWPPKHLARRSLAFGSIGRAKLSPQELESLLEIFKKEHFLLVVGANIKNPPDRLLPAHPSRTTEEGCHIVLHTKASNLDIVKSTFALLLLRQALAPLDAEPSSMRTKDYLPLIKESLEKTNETFPGFLRELYKQGWESPARFMFGRVRMRADWPIQK